MEKLEIKEIKANEKKERKSFEEIFKENKTVFYSIMFYTAGLLLGSFIYIKCNNESLNELITASNSNNFLNIFINNLGLYFFIYAISVLLGICLIGFPFINLLPMIMGFQGGLKVAFYYVNYGYKGFGYNLLMIAPFICSFLTLLIFSIAISYDLSKKIYLLTKSNSNISDKINYKKYLKKYLIYAALVILIALINSAVTLALNGIISI
ncbi:MAG: stage II sporulation protein M [Clostridiales bacterium]|nr:stage II sporulation protein M [Clostridiales bacterium]